MKLILIWIPLLIVSLVGFTDHTPAVPVNKAVIGQAAVQQMPQDVSDATSLKAAVDGWLAALAKESKFEVWKTAKWESLPLGPGTHSWLIVIRDKNVEVGYLIVGAMEDGKHYKLLEYGLGAQPLFSFNTLYHSMMQQALIDPKLTFTAFTVETDWLKERYYLSTLENFWRITRGSQIYYLDAKSGEFILDEIDPLENSAQLLDLKASADELNSQKPIQQKESIARDSYDPFEKLSWINGKPLVISSAADLKLAMKNHPNLTYMSKLYQANLIHPFAITGYHVWNSNQAYISLDDEGARFIPLSSLLQVGAFYP